MNAVTFSPGDRVRLVSMNDSFAKVPIGVEGTVKSAAPPPVNVLNVEWDDGFSLNPCLDEDIVELVRRA